MNALFRAPVLLSVLMVFSVLLSGGSDASLENTYLTAGTVLLAAFFVLMAYTNGVRTSFRSGCLYLYITLQGLLCSQVLGNVLTKAAAGQALLMFTALMFWAVLIGKPSRRALYLVLRVAALVQALGIYFAPVPSSHVYFLGNPSMAATFIAILLTAERNPWDWMCLFPALLLTQTSTPLFALAVGVTIRFIYAKRPRTQLRRLVWAATPVLLSGLCYGMALPKFVSGGNGRFDVWSLAWGSLSYPRSLFGWGLGSTPLVMPLLQLQNGTSPESQNFFLFLHNDWLQIYFELGLIGLLLSLAFYWQTLGRMRRDPRLLGMGVAYGAAMVTNFPLHSPLFLILAVSLVSEAWNDGQTSTEAV